ncbi:MAG: 16S rRNA (guanine(966)-N(2))-methyltransferase RsmD [Holosporaceae bacterium]|jgi:16S rRNA (guanine966-N2)-methyltransferase|nr:16S rRNA (guanine(966)-N(2))-methyltransferase RsmD [Holosporaceae bacterium]
MSIRIISGKFKGFSIEVPNSARPTLSRRRQSLFDMLEATSPGGNGFFTEKIVMDCFAGSGAFGFEALSRGAARAYFIDSDSQSIALIHSNSKKMKTADSTTIIHSKVEKLKRSSAAVDVVFLDPPYGKVSISKVLEYLLHKGWISENTIIITEEDASKTESFEEYQQIISKIIGNTIFKIIQYK